MFKTANYRARPRTIELIKCYEAPRARAGLLIDPITSCVGCVVRAN